LPGEAEGTGLQITDRNNNAASDFTFPGTVVPLSFPVPMGCTPTVDTTRGSTCNAQTTANTLVPGIFVP
jgi:hypothetical protein